MVKANHALSNSAQVYIIPIENESLTCCLKNMSFFKKIIGEE